jgi:hypothetical protein
MGGGSNAAPTLEVSGVVGALEVMEAVPALPVGRGVVAPTVVNGGWEEPLSAALHAAPDNTQTTLSAAHDLGMLTDLRRTDNGPHARLRARAPS